MHQNSTHDANRLRQTSRRHSKEPQQNVGGITTLGKTGLPTRFPMRIQLELLREASLELFDLQQLSLFLLEVPKDVKSARGSTVFRPNDTGSEPRQGRRDSSENFHDEHRLSQSSLLLNTKGG